MIIAFPFSKNLILNNQQPADLTVAEVSQLDYLSREHGMLSLARLRRSLLTFRSDKLP